MSSALALAFAADLATAKREAAITRRAAVDAEAYFADSGVLAQRVETAIAAAAVDGVDPTAVFGPAVVAAIAALTARQDPATSDLIPRLASAIDAVPALKKAFGARRRTADIQAAASGMVKATAISALAPGVVVIDPRDQVAVARHFLEWCGRVGGFPVYAVWRASWYEYVAERGCYLERSLDVVRKRAQAFLAAAVVETKHGFSPALNDSRAVEEVVRTTATLTLVDAPSAAVEIDAGHAVVGAPRRVVTFANLSVDLDALERGERHPYLSNGPSLFVINGLAITYDPDATAPLFAQFLIEICDGDLVMRDALILLMGYVLSGDMSLQVLFLFVGISRSGKGTFVRILSALIGVDNVNATNLSQLNGNPFALSALLDKTLAVCTDSHAAGGDSAVLSELLCSIVGQDAVTINRKHLPLLTNVRLRCRFLLLMNEFVPLSDKAGALRNRLVAFRFTEFPYIGCNCL